MVTFLKLLLKQGIMGSPTPSYSGKSIQIISTQQPNRILIHKPILIRIVIPEAVVMQPRLAVDVLVLQAEGLVCAIRNLGFLFQTTLAGVFSVPQQIPVLIGHLSRDADLVAVEVVGLLDAFAFFVGPVVYLCVTHMPYVRIESFMRATTYLFIFISITIALKRRI